MKPFRKTQLTFSYRGSLVRIAFFLLLHEIIIWNCIVYLFRLSMADFKYSLVIWSCCQCDKNTKPKDVLMRVNTSSQLCTDKDVYAVPALEQIASALSAHRDVFINMGFLCYLKPCGRLIALPLVADWGQSVSCQRSAGMWADRVNKLIPLPFHLFLPRAGKGRWFQAKLIQPAGSSWIRTHNRVSGL